MGRNAARERRLAFPGRLAARLRAPRGRRLLARWWATASLFVSVPSTQASPHPADTGDHTAGGRGSARSHRGKAPVSPRAYEHWIRSRLALQDDDYAGAAEHLLLGLVYDEASPHLRSSLARVRLHQGQLDKATRILSKLGRPHASRAEFHRLRGRVAAARGRYAKAERQLEAAVRADGRWQDHLELFDLAIARGDVPASLGRLRQGLATHGRRPELWRRLAEALAGDVTQASAARRAREKAASLSVDGRADVLAALQLDHRSGEDELAAERVAALRERWPTHPLVVRASVETALWRSEPSAAQAVSREGIRLGALEALPLLKLLAAEGVAVRGRTYGVRFRRFAPQLGPWSRARLWLARGDERAARRAWSELRPEHSRYPEAQILRAESLADLGRFGAAVRVLEAALEASPRGPGQRSLWRALMDFRLREAPPETAEALARDLRSSDFGFAPVEGLLAAGSTRAASLVLDALGAVPEGGAQRPRWEALIRVVSGRPRPVDREALEAARWAAPDEPGILAALGRIAHLEGRPEPGRRLLERSARLDPRSARTWRWLAELLSALDDQPGARRAEQRARNRDLADRRARRHALWIEMAASSVAPPENTDHAHTP